MTEFTESEEDGEIFKPNGRELGLNLARKNGSKLDHPERGDRLVPRQDENPAQRADEAYDQDDLDLINEVIEDLARPHRAKRQTNRLTEQAAALVARYGSQASTDSIFKECAARLTKHLDARLQGRDPVSEEWFEGHTTSEAFLEDSELIRVMFKAASLAGNEREAGLQAALSVPLMIQQYRRVYRGLWPAIPALSAGMDILARFLYRAETRRSLVSELPKVLRATLDRLAWYVSHRRAITSGLASTVLAEQTGIWLASRSRRNVEEDRNRRSRPSVNLPENLED